jgi:hypothetical protein
MFRVRTRNKVDSMWNINRESCGNGYQSSKPASSALHVAGYHRCLAATGFTERSVLFFSLGESEGCSIFHEPQQSVLRKDDKDSFVECLWPLSPLPRASSNFHRL